MTKPLLLLLVTLSALAAETPTPILYVSDQLLLGLRAGAAKEQKIINYVKAGETVQILDRAPGTGFVRIRASSGPEGWVEVDKVVNAPPAVLRYAELESKYEQVTRELDDLKVSTPERDELIKQVERLQHQVLELENQNEKLNQSNALLERRFQSEVMYAGAVIVVIGMLLGWMMTAMKSRRRDVLR